MSDIDREEAEAFASFSDLCECGHMYGDHAAMKDRDLGGWPCLEGGCECVLDDL